MLSGSHKHKHMHIPHKDFWSVEQTPQITYIITALNQTGSLLEAFYGHISKGANLQHCKRTRNIVCGGKKYATVIGILKKKNRKKGHNMETGATGICRVREYVRQHRTRLHAHKC